MKKLIQSAAMILGFSLISITTNAATVKTKAPAEICYWFNSQGLLGEWEEQVLVSKKKLTFKQAHAYMQKNHGMSDMYDIEELPADECDAVKGSFGTEPNSLFHYKEPKIASQAKPKSTANQPKKTSLSKSD